MDRHITGIQAGGRDQRYWPPYAFVVGPHQELETQREAARRSVLLALASRSPFFAAPRRSCLKEKRSFSHAASSPRSGTSSSSRRAQREQGHGGQHAWSPCCSLSRVVAGPTAELAVPSHGIASRLRGPQAAGIVPALGMRFDRLVVQVQDMHMKIICIATRGVSTPKMNLIRDPDETVPPRSGLSNDLRNPRMVFLASCALVAATRTWKRHRGDDQQHGIIGSHKEFTVAAAHVYTHECWLGATGHGKGRSRAIVVAVLSSRESRLSNRIASAPARSRQPAKPGLDAVSDGAEFGCRACADGLRLARATSTHAARHDPAAFVQDKGGGGYGTGDEAAWEKERFSFKQLPARGRRKRARICGAEVVSLLQRESPLTFP
ncbi:hypothetical protein GGX14DRAFT_393918 [Mycena pura]|uniref:Uncharacterized protein n=1 Tax=Mycena pura TaxID=153505 RepID=A0AAD6YG35_9AGAR|nr:hypothetical protein GGX14DRAFT_393918 [Mycena pura]